MKSYLRIRVKAFKYAINGLSHFFKEAHARIHLVFTVLVLISAAILQVETWEWIALLFCCAFVLSTEAVNSALENLTDIASPKIQPLAGLVKDLAAAAVLIASIFAAVIGLIIFVPKIITLF
jgi:diacylglycerol kinase